METILINLLVFGLLIAAIVVFTSFWQILNVVLQYPTYKIADPKQVPTAIKDYYQNVISPILSELGFEFCSYLDVEMIEVGQRQWQMLMHNPKFKTFATTSIPVLLSDKQPTHIWFYSYLSDGRLLITGNGKAHMVVGKLPAAIMLDPYAATTAEQWQCHRDQLFDLGDREDIQAQAMTSAEFIERLESHHAAFINEMGRSQSIYPLPKVDSGSAPMPPDKAANQFGLNLIPAFKLTLQILGGNNKMATMLKAKANLPESHPEQGIEIPVAIEVNAFKRLDRAKTQSSNRSRKIWLLLISLLAFIGLGTFWFTQVHLVLIIVAVLFIHEMGHYLAMRWFGYEDTSIFFLPLFGAAALGRKDDATLFQKVMVLMAGPMPGILLSVGLWQYLFWFGRSIDSIITPPLLDVAIAETLLWMLTLNFFNILPIFPLDGGKVVGLLLFSFNPTIDATFKGIAAGILILLGVSASPVLMILGMLIAFSVPTTLRNASIFEQVKGRREARAFNLNDRSNRSNQGDRHMAELQPEMRAIDDSEQLLFDIFTEIKNSEHAKLPLEQKYNIAKDILQRVGETNASWLTRTMLTAGYLICLFGSLAVLVRVLPLAMSFTGGYF
jgi:Zn-dependent protease